LEKVKTAFGEKATKNLQTLSKIGKDVGDFNKKWKGVTGGLSASDVLSGAGAFAVALQGNYPLAATIIGIKHLGKRGLANFYEKMLTDPAYQSLQIRGLNALKNQSLPTLRNVHNSFKKKLEEDDIDAENF
jgi:hypothetical protein